MDVLLSALLGNYDKSTTTTDQRTNQQKGDHRGKLHFNDNFEKGLKYIATNIDNYASILQ